MFILNKNIKISLDGLLAEANKGISVVKTPHVGNVYPNNLAIAGLGIRMLFYDRTFGKQDYLFHPHMVIVGGKSHIVADPDIITSHNRVTQSPDCVNGNFPVGEFVSDCHMGVLRKSIPIVKAETYTNYIFRHREELLPILQYWTYIMPSVWKRRVECNGVVSECVIESWEDASRVGVLGIHSNVEGLIIPNVYNVALSAVIEALESGIDRQIHLSGPVMIKYIDKMVRDVSLLCDAARKVNTAVPECITMDLVPVASMVFVAPQSRKTLLDELVKLLLENLDAFLDGRCPLSSNEWSCIVKHARDCVLPIQKPRRATAFSQHDINPSDPLVVANSVKNLPMEWFQRAHSLLAKIQM